MVLPTLQLAGVVAMPGPAYGKQIIDGSWGGLLRTIDAATGEVVHRQLFDQTSIQWIACTADRTVFVYVMQPKAKDHISPLPFSHVVLRKWPFVHHAGVELHVGEAYVHAAALSPDGSRLALVKTSRSSELTLQIIELPAGRSGPGRAMNFAGTSFSLAWSPDGSKLGCIEKGRLSLFDSTSLAIAGRYVDDYACHVDFSPDGSRICIASWEQGAVVDMARLDCA